jgi:L-amino acid N-acyltransferase YncA
VLRHRAAGFRELGVRERIGRHASQANRWRDVVFIEHRSQHVA